MQSNRLPTPLVVTVPDAGERYYSIQMMEMYSDIFGYIGQRATGNKAGHADVPREEMLAVFHEVYPNYRDWIREGAAGDFAREVDTGPRT